MGSYFLKNKNLFFLIFLISIVIGIYFPIFYTEYLYTDEANQIWLTKKGINYQTSVPQGRYITYIIMEWLFGYINTVHDVIYVRLFSFFGWIFCLPIWFFIINKLCIKSKFSKVLVMLFMIYLISMPPFIIYIGWSACMQMFIACTSALLAGYLLYNGINYIDNRVTISTSVIIVTIFLGLMSLFTYQNCYGCFFIPFFIHFISTKKFSKTIYIGIIFSLATFIIYYAFFKYSLNVSSLAKSERTTLTTNPVNKLLFFFARPLQSAFHFTYIFNEKSIIGFIIYTSVSFAWLLINYIRQKTKKFSEKITYLFGLNLFAIMIYLPSLIVKENYSSNRTLFALDLFVFFLVAETLFSLIKRNKIQLITASGIGALFLLNAWYNYNKQFIDPLKIEYDFLKKNISESYKPDMSAVYFICPSEKFFENKYNITPSWDEFGQPSTSKLWVPDPLIRQLIFEKIGDRQVADKILIKCWPSEDAFDHSGDLMLKKSMIIKMNEY